MVYMFLKTSGSNTSGGGVKSEIMKNKELAKELHKAIIRKLKKQKVLYMGWWSSRCAINN